MRFSRLGRYSRRPLRAGETLCACALDLPAPTPACRLVSETRVFSPAKPMRKSIDNCGGPEPAVECCEIHQPSEPRLYFWACAHMSIAWPAHHSQPLHATCRPAVFRHDMTYPNNFGCYYLLYDT
ncbi:hypothetical protein GQ53DRAFT_120619 [Thozetella sp. PMI_491]|nr:hypothetical protein GQ53DRAFT_120619 [Thozetella sp. PMI_491]